MCSANARRRASVDLGFDARWSALTRLVTAVIPHIETRPAGRLQQLCGASVQRAARNDRGKKTRGHWPRNSTVAVGIELFTAQKSLDRLNTRFSRQQRAILYISLSCGNNVTAHLRNLSECFLQPDLFGALRCGGRRLHLRFGRCRLRVRRRAALSGSRSI